MTGHLNTTHTGAYDKHQDRPYCSSSDLVDFILGITFEIWEQRQVEKIHDYYSENVEVYSLEGMTRRAATMVNNTYQTLTAFPDRLLLASDVITRGTTEKGFSSHRIISPMTNLGKTSFAPPTGQRVQTMNIADCEVNDGLITREWLLRDNLAMIRQLGLDPVECAKIIAKRLDKQQRSWLVSEYKRTATGVSSTNFQLDPTDAIHCFAASVLEGCWKSGDNESLISSYAPYCVLHRAPLQVYSGRQHVLEHYNRLRTAFPTANLCIDHISSQPFDRNNQRIAVRWSVAAVHEGEFANTAASGESVYILGVTHWEVVDGRITAEWTVFDELSVIAQTLSEDNQA